MAKQAFKITKNVKTFFIIFAAVAIIVGLLSLLSRRERYVNGKNVNGYDSLSFSYASLEAFANEPVATVYLFHASWCGHCQEYLKKKDPKTNKNVFETVSAMEDLKAYEFKMLDFDENKELASKYGVNSFPTIIKVTTPKNKAPIVKVFEGNRDDIKQIVDFVKSA